MLLKSGRAGQIDAAVTDLQDLVKSSPENPVWRFSLGRALAIKGDNVAARLQFQEAIKRRANFLPPRLALAELSRRGEEYSQTLRYANEILAIKPNLASARLLKAVGLIGTQRYGEARAELNDLEKELPQDRQVPFQIAVLEVVEKKFPAAEARLQKLYADGKGDPSALAALVEAYRAEGHADKALALLNAELKKSPDSAPVRALLADTALRSGQYDLALEHYQFLLAKGVRSARLEERLGTIYELKGKLTEAIASFQTAKQLAPRDPVAALALADALRLANRKSEAISTYRSVLELDPENTKAMNHLAYLLVGQDGKLDEAQALVLKALQKDPRQPDFEDTLGLVYLKKGRSEDAVLVSKNLVKKYPTNPLFLYHYGLALLESGQRAGAKTELETALSLRPSDEVRNGIEASLARLR